MSLTLEVEHSRNVLIVRVGGELDHHTAAQVRTKIEEEMDKEIYTHLVLNLENLHFMDSSGLGVIIGRYKRVSQIGGKMMLCSISTPIARLLEMSGLFKILSIYEDEKSAVHACEVAI